MLPCSESSYPCFLVQRAVVRASLCRGQVVRASLYRGQNCRTCWGLGACLAWAVQQGDTGGHQVGGDESVVGRWRSVGGAAGLVVRRKAVLGGPHGLATPPDHRHGFLEADLPVRLLQSAARSRSKPRLPAPFLETLP